MRLVEIGTGHRNKSPGLISDLAFQEMFQGYGRIPCVPDDDPAELRPGNWGPLCTIVSIGSEYIG